MLIVTNSFEKLARAIVDTLGDPDALMVVVEHPLGGTPKEHIHEVGRRAAGSLLELMAATRGDGSGKRTG